MATGTRLISLNCSSCGAELDVEDGRDICFCTYCGAKILIEQSDAAIKARARSKMVNDISDKAMQYAKERREYKDRKQKESLKMMAVYFAVMMLAAIGYYLYSKYLR